MTDIFKTISRESYGEFKNKGSKFFAYAFPVKTEEEAMAKIEMIKNQHFKARHFCYAYKLGYDDNLFRYNDDGEPSGTAGKPIFGQILSFDVTNLVIIVVRYFGGTKLGVSGLIEAYREASKDSLVQNDIEEKYLSTLYELEFDYEHMGSIMNILKNLSFDIEDKLFNETCKVKVVLRRSQEIERLRTLKATLLNVSEEYIDEETQIEFCEFSKIEEDA